MRYAIAVFLILVWATGCSQSPEPANPAPKAQKKSVEPVKILHFYASPAQVAKGEEVTVCYGVESARTVRLEPAGEELKPYFNRCFQVTPAKNTTYRLIAEGYDGKTISESVTVKVAAPSSRSVPREYMIKFFTTNSTDLVPGQTATLCYNVQGAKELTLEPNVQQLKSIERFCFWIKPRETTTYVLTATAPDGKKETAKLTITVK